MNREDFEKRQKHSSISVRRGPKRGKSPDKFPLPSISLPSQIYFFSSFLVYLNFSAVDRTRWSHISPLKIIHDSHNNTLHAVGGRSKVTNDKHIKSFCRGVIYDCGKSARAHIRAALVKSGPWPCACVRGARECISIASWAESEWTGRNLV